MPIKRGPISSDKLHFPNQTSQGQVNNDNDIYKDEKLQKLITDVYKEILEIKKDLEQMRLMKPSPVV